MEALRATISAIGDAMAGLVFSSIRILGVDVQLIVIWLFAGMVFFTLRLGFINLRGFGTAVSTLRGAHYDPKAPGEMSPFQALSTALSGTIGLGNIAGVAIAIAIGGPGATFWMVVIGFFAMSLKCAEVVLAVKYRSLHEDGSVSGGPMWYLSRGLADHGMRRFGKVLGTIYAAFALIAVVQFIQVNQSYSQLSIVLGTEESPGFALAYGIAIAVLAAVVLIGGAKSIAQVTSRLTPLMCLIYVTGILVVLGANITEVPHAIALIVRDAFSVSAATGGLLGAFVAGMRRAAYSNESGIGTASIAHATVRTHYPASEGFVALIEPFIDTVLICTATALAIVTTGVWQGDYTDIAMTSAAFGSVSSGFPYILACAVCLFAFSTILAAGYYGQQACGYLFGDSRRARLAYLTAFCGLLPIGVVADMATVINIIDSLFFLLSVPNLIGLYLMSGTVHAEISRFRTYLADGQRESG